MMKNLFFILKIVLLSLFFTPFAQVTPLLIALALIFAAEKVYFMEMSTVVVTDEVPLLQSQIKSLEAEVQETEFKLEGLQEALVKYQNGSEFKLLKSHFEEKKQELIELRRALFLSQEEIEALERRLNDEREAIDLNAFQTFANLSQEVETLHNERTLLQDIIAQLQKEQSYASYSASSAT